MAAGKGDHAKEREGGRKEGRRRRERGRRMRDGGRIEKREKKCNVRAGSKDMACKVLLVLTTCQWSRRELLLGHRTRTDSEREMQK